MSGTSRSRRLPILMYHSISDHADDGLNGYFKVNTPPLVFKDHLRVLKEEGFEAIGLAAGLAMLSSETPPDSARKFVAITFDDGFRDFETVAWPALREHGFTATMYLPTAYIGDQRKQFLGRECMTWDEVRRLSKEGAFFGSHTVNHPLLVQLSPAELRSELRDSKKTIEAELGIPIEEFAHPYGFPLGNTRHETVFRKTLMDEGYKIGVTTILGSARPGGDPLLLPRLPANGADDPRLFRAKIRGAYDWISRPQRWVKWVRNVLTNRSRFDSRELEAAPASSTRRP